MLSCDKIIKLLKLKEGLGIKKLIKYSLTLASASLLVSDFYAGSVTNVW